MISDRDTNFVYFSDLLMTNPEFSKTGKQITDILDSFGFKWGLLPHTNDIWARDYMPIQISDSKFIEYRYDPDYLQGTRKDYRNSKTYPDIVCDEINLKTIKTNIILDGGNVVKSEDCIILADKIVIENRLLCSKKELVTRLKETFEVEKVVLIPWDTLEVYGHSDGVLRFIDERTVLINRFYETDKKLFYILKQNGLISEFLKFKVRKQHKWNWAYINFLQTKDLILLPKFNIDEDPLAFEQIEKYYPDYANNKRIAQVDMSEIVKYDGALNCISWSIKK